MTISGADQLVLETGDARAVFDSAGARLTSLRLGGRELLRTDDARADVWYGAFLMVPWAGLLPDAVLHFGGDDYAMLANWGDDSLHGMARFAEFEISGNTLFADLPHPWPFDAAVTVAPVLSEDALQVSIRLDAKAHRMPGGIGWHPWFARTLDGSGPAAVELPGTARKRERDASGAPNGSWIDPGEGPWDDCFATDDAVTLRWPDAGALMVSSNAGFIGVFDGEESGVAVEPMTAPVGPVDDVVEPGDPALLVVTLTWMSE
jgi:aldose 1-epimerase